MHELSIAVSIVDGVLEEVERRGATDVSAVHVRIGRLSGVDKDALLFSWNVATEGTPLAHSSLLIEDVDVVVLCPTCNAERPIECFPLLACAQCGSLAPNVVHGQELEITAMEVEA